MNRLLIGLVCLGLAASPGRAEGPAVEAEADDAKSLADAGVKADGPSLLDFLRKRIPSEEKRALVRKLVRELGSDEFDVRERASKAVVALGPVARPQLLQALNDPNREVRRRAEKALRRIPQEDAHSPVGAVVRQVARVKPLGAVETLLSFLPEAEDQDVVEAVGKALVQVGLEGRKPHALILKAAGDRQVRLRLAACAVLCRADKKYRGEALKFLSDPDAGVRLAAALNLLEVRDRESVPA